MVFADYPDAHGNPGARPEGVEVTEVTTFFPSELPLGQAGHEYNWQVIAAYADCILHCKARDSTAGGAKATPAKCNLVIGSIC